MIALPVQGVLEGDDEVELPPRSFGCGLWRSPGRSHLREERRVGSFAALQEGVSPGTPAGSLVKTLLMTLS